MIRKSTLQCLALLSLVGPAAGLIDINNGDVHTLAPLKFSYKEGLPVSVEVELPQPGTGKSGKIMFALDQNHKLFSQSYAEYEFDEDFNLVEVSEEIDTSCHFIGRGIALSTCSGRAVGCVIKNGQMFDLEHSLGSNETAVRRTLSSSRAGTHFDNGSENSPLEHIEIRAKQLKASPIAKSTTGLQAQAGLYVEILLVSDTFRVSQFDTMESLRENNVQVANQVGAFFSLLDTQVPVQLSLSGQVYLSTDVVGSSDDASSMLKAINTWRQNHYEELPQHDVMHLMSGRSFSNSILGLAHKGAACDMVESCGQTGENQCATQGGEEIGCCRRSAAAISTVRKNVEAFSAETVTHEIAHQLGFHHDVQGSTNADCQSSVSEYYFMAATPRINRFLDLEWSECSKATFHETLSETYNSWGYHPYGCLLNKPGTPQLSLSAATTLLSQWHSATVVVVVVVMSAFEFM